MEFFGPYLSALCGNGPVGEILGVSSSGPPEKHQPPDRESHLLPNSFRGGGVHALYQPQKQFLDLDGPRLDDGTFPVQELSELAHYEEEDGEFSAAPHSVGRRKSQKPFNPHGNNDEEDKKEDRTASEGGDFASSSFDSIDVGLNAYTSPSTRTKRR